MAVNGIWECIVGLQPLICDLWSFCRNSRKSIDVKVKRWGGTGGSNPWTFIPDGRISKIQILTGECVDSIRFTYTDHAGVEHNSAKFGGDGGSPYVINIGDDESLSGISGTFGEHLGITVIKSLSFKTNTDTTFGPYGNNVQGTSFSLEITKGKFAGFRGNYGSFLDSFGVILHPY